MMYLPLPTVDDQDTLRLIANTTSSASYPMLLTRLRRLLRRYETYVAAGGNPWNLRILPRSVLTDKLKAALKYHYDQPSGPVDYLDRIRSSSSPDICPMCGSPNTFSIDHVFPRSKYPEFSIFSRNLVPACSCNFKRGERLKGTRRGQRVLHPYFDSGMRSRLIRARIKVVDDGFVKPEITLVICIRQSNPIYAAVKFHLENVLLRTNVISNLDAFWLRLLRNPKDYLTLPNGPFSQMQLDQAVNDQLEILDRRRSTPNNWESMLFAGLRKNPAAKAFLKSHIEDLRSGVLNPADI